MSRQCDSCQQKEYCRDAKNPVVTGCSAYWKAEEVKIRCDDCKFQESCVDYGWEGCKKFTPKPSEPMTNEEWMHSLNASDLAHFLSVEAARAISEYQNRDTKRTGVDFWKRWLKAVHKE